MESCYERTSRWQCWSGVPAKWPLWFQSLLRGAAHISIAVSSIFGSSTASFILFRRFWATFPRVFSRFLSSLLRYTQPYGRATITFLFRQFSLFLLHQSYWSPMMQFWPYVFQPDFYPADHYIHFSSHDPFYDDEDKLRWDFLATASCTFLGPVGSATKGSRKINRLP